MKVAVFLFHALWLWGSGVFVLSKADSRWMEDIQGLFNVVVFSYSLPTVHIIWREKERF